MLQENKTSVACLLGLGVKPILLVKRESRIKVEFVQIFHRNLLPWGSYF